jgi:hypothetical protein
LRFSTRFPVPGVRPAGASGAADAHSDEESDVSDAFYVSRGRVVRIDGLHRRATIATGTEFDIGVHGPIKEHYRLDAKDLPLPVDYIVAATAG